jgi:hypothetical protein
MAYGYKIDRQRRMVHVWMSGPLTVAEVREVAGKLAADPEVTGSFVELIDLREATTDAISAAATLDSATRRAFVTSDTLTYGLARMFGTHRELNRKQDVVAVFRRIADAEQWLGVTLSSETHGGDDRRNSGQ